MNYKIIKKEAFPIQGYKRKITTKNGENFKLIPAFWDEVMSNGSFDKLLNKAGNLGVVGVITDFNMNLGEFDYYIGIEGTQSDGEFFSTVIPEGDYAVFQAIGPLPESIQAVWKKIPSEFFEVTDYEHRGTAELEVYYPGNTQDEDYVSEIWIPVK